jgi:DNA polymerase/3'-5' exonuclease PolX
MTNKEWLEEVKEYDDVMGIENEYKNTDYRQAKALEIIAEELIKLNENGGVMELVKVGLND